MKGFELTDQELHELRKAHKAARNRYAAYKINALILLGSHWTLSQVKEALLLDEETLRSYVSKYKTGGIQELVSTNYHGSKCSLDDTQLKALKEELETSIYLTTAAIIEFVEREFEVRYTNSGMRDLLHREGYEFKKPKLVPGNPNLAAQEEFVDLYEEFMATKSDTTEVIFVDAVHPEHNTMAAYGWIKRGQTRKLKTNSGRQRLNLHGGINVETMEMTLIEAEAANKDSTVQLLELLDNKYSHSERVVVILDNAKYHYSKEVKDVVAASTRLHLVYLPSYSPELNLIERVWKFFKKKVLYNKYYEDVAAFRKSAIQFFSNIHEYDHELRSLLDGGFEGIYT